MRLYFYLLPLHSRPGGGALTSCRWSTRGTSGWDNTPAWRTRWNPRCCSGSCPGLGRCGRWPLCRWISADEGEKLKPQTRLVWWSVGWEGLNWAEVTHTNHLSKFILQQLLQLLLAQGVLVSLLAGVFGEGGDEESHGLLDVRHVGGQTWKHTNKWAQRPAMKGEMTPENDGRSWPQVKAGFGSAGESCGADIFNFSPTVWRKK